jgi:hypothetical protein
MYCDIWIFAETHCTIEGFWSPRFIAEKIAVSLISHLGEHLRRGWPTWLQQDSQSQRPFWEDLLVSKLRDKRTEMRVQLHNWLRLVFG